MTIGLFVLDFIHRLDEYFNALDYRCLKLMAARRDGAPLGHDLGLILRLSSAKTRRPITHNNLLLNVSYIVWSTDHRILMLPIFSKFKARSGMWDSNAACSTDTWLLIALSSHRLLRGERYFRIFGCQTYQVVCSIRYTIWEYFRARLKTDTVSGADPLCWQVHQKYSYRRLRLQPIYVLLL